MEKIIFLSLAIPILGFVFYLGGTAILIGVVVAIDTVTQIQTRLMSSQYEKLIKKTKFGK